MSIPVILSVCGRQSYMGQDPDVIELVTEGTLEYLDGGWNISYAESALTGLEGVNTTFQLEDGCVTLTRTGRLNSQMIFEEGIPHDSLYEMEFGALLMTVCAQMIEASIGDDGGTVDLQYSIAIENNDAGLVEYHLDIRPKA